MNVVLIEPEIPPNTGNIARLCMASNTTLHLVEPFGFRVDDATLRRAGMDYWHEVDVRIHKSFDAVCVAAPKDAAFYFLTTQATRSYLEPSYRESDYLVFGREHRAAAGVAGGECASMRPHPDVESSGPQPESGHVGGDRALRGATADARGPARGIDL